MPNSSLVCTWVLDGSSVTCGEPAQRRHIEDSTERIVLCDEHAELVSSLERCMWSRPGDPLMCGARPARGRSIAVSVAGVTEPLALVVCDRHAEDFLRLVDVVV
jgi:hypothetical protein